MMSEEIRVIAKPPVGNDYSTPIYARADGKKALAHALWGDRVFILQDDGGPRVRARVRGRKGWIDRGRLGDETLLELYFIDVGQGDGVLVVTPDGRHILIDGGWPRAKQPTRKNAADFVDWKFKVEYGRDDIALDAMICSHNDEDHYGGLSDLLDPKQADELRVATVTAEAFYHAGLSWWVNAQTKERELGASVNTEFGDMFVQLLGDRDHARACLKSGANSELQGVWKTFIRRATTLKTRAGTPTPMTRLSHAIGTLPGFGTDESTAIIHVLGPVEFEVEGQAAIRRFDRSNSQNTNGNSVLLRIDYGDVRVLLTGDLNRKSQRALLDDYDGEHGVFAADVAKCCHHGSDDVSLSFLQAINPKVTVISSGDSEGHDHPRPNVIAASALTGNRQVVDDELITPLIYCTELARSVSIGHPSQLRIRGEDNVEQVFAKQDFEHIELDYQQIDAGDINPSKHRKSLAQLSLVTNLIYGLINVRTDGETIMCAALNEKKGTWNVKIIKA